MRTVGFVGVGKIGMPICEHLVTGGYRVLGYRRSAMTAFEAIGGVPARSPAEIGREADIVLSCMPSSEALDEVMQGPDGLVQSARPGQIVVELGSHPLAEKRRHLAPFADKGAAFVDGEVSGTPGMVVARKAVVYLAGDRDACRRVEELTKAFADMTLYFGPFGAASKVKLINNLLVAVNIAATAEAMALGLRAGVDTDLMIKAVANGSGGSTQFGIRAPWMAQRKFLPQQGSAQALAHYFDMIDDLSAEVGVATPILDRIKEIFAKGIPMIGERDVAAIIEAIEAWPRPDSVSKQEGGSQ